MVSQSEREREPAMGRLLALPAHIRLLRKNAKENTLANFAEESVMKKTKVLTFRQMGLMLSNFSLH
jgi:hypothetical protein